METPRNETEAYLALVATVYDRAADAVTVRIAELAADPVPVPIRKPGDPRDVPAAAAGELAAEDVRPGMRQIGGQWFYSAAWL